MEWNQKMWRRSVGQLAAFLEPLAVDLRRCEQREGLAYYVQGLLIPGERKSIEPMAQRLSVDKQKLQQLIADSPWNTEEVWRAIRQEVVPTLEPLAAWIVDETGWVKQGEKSVGVARQYCGAVGKRANCQVSVEIVVSDGQIAAPVAGRLYLTEDWVADGARCQAAGVPPEVQFQTKPEIALDLIRQVSADGVAPAPVLGDEVYGRASELRRGLRQLNLEYCLNAPAALLAWTEPMATRRSQQSWDIAPGQPKAQSLGALSRNIPPDQWQDVAWHSAEGTRRQTRIAWRAVYVRTDLDRATGEWPQTWLVVDWPEGEAEPYHLYLARLKRQPSAKYLLRLTRGRFTVEQFFQRAKTDLGLDQYEGRSWRGFHHHLVLAAVAYLFVLVIYLRSKKNFWCYVGTGAARDSAVAGAIDRTLSLLRDSIPTSKPRLQLT